MEKIFIYFNIWEKNKIYRCSTLPIVPSPPRRRRGRSRRRKVNVEFYRSWNIANRYRRFIWLLQNVCVCTFATSNRCDLFTSVTIRQNATNSWRTEESQQSVLRVCQISSHNRCNWLHACKNSIAGWSARWKLSEPKGMVQYQCTDSRRCRSSYYQHRCALARRVAWSNSFQCFAAETSTRGWRLRQLFNCGRLWISQYHVHGDTIFAECYRFTAEGAVQRQPNSNAQCCGALVWNLETTISRSLHRN